jgi:carbonic anhydrase/acetyltransferase-like protein (isoleucine patch superfamily)
MVIRAFEQFHPDIHATAYIDEMAMVSGQVTIGEDSSVWPMTVIRGDVNTITIGSRTNLQDGSVLHVTHPSETYTSDTGFSLHIGDDVTVGHKALLHACQVQDRCLIGMGAIVLDGAVIESETLLAAGSLVPPGKLLQGGYLWMGSPAVRVRRLSKKELDYFTYSAAHYVQLKARTKV